MAKQNPPPKKRRARRKTEPRAIYDAIYYAASRYGCKSREEETLEDIERAYAAGADVNERDEDWRTALMFAAQYRRKACIHALLAHGADVSAKDAEGDYALQYMPSFLYFANPDIVQLLTPPKEH